MLNNRTLSSHLLYIASDNNYTKIYHASYKSIKIRFSFLA